MWKGDLGVNAGRIAFGVLRNLRLDIRFTRLRRRRHWNRSGLPRSGISCQADGAGLTGQKRNRAANARGPEARQGRECTRTGSAKTGNVHGSEPQMRRHLRRWLTQDACKLAAPLRLRPVRPVLSLAPATRHSVASARRAWVRMRIDAGTQAAATPNPPSPRHAAPHAYQPSHGGVLLRAALAGRRRLGNA